MTLCTYVHYICQNGHRGVEKTLENDQPYSKMWEKVMLTGMKKKVNNLHYFCDVCSEVMSVAEVK